jgi:secondary thiamine-phosphate synthase enzyme
MIYQTTLTVRSLGRGTHEVTEQLQTVVRKAGVKTGLAHIFLEHTSASLILCENADPLVRRDLETFMTRLIPDGASWFEHDYEGPDDMPAHIRAILTHNSLTVPVTGGRCALGTWQGIYLWEHRYAGHGRQLTITVQGE